jgi:hypothetical protein
MLATLPVEESASEASASRNLPARGECPWNNLRRVRGITQLIGFAHLVSLALVCSAPW